MTGRHSRRSRRQVLATATAGLASLAGCGALQRRERPGTDAGTVTTRQAAGGATVAPPTGAGDVAYTFGRATGNRVASGRGALPDVDPVDVPLGGTPAWVVGTAVPDGSLWAVALEDGRLLVHVVRDATAERTTAGTESLPAGTPLALDARGDTPRVLGHPHGASALTHPTTVGDALVHVAESGSVVVRRDGETWQFDVDALRDGRVVTDGDHRAAVLTRPTGRYVHGALGDATEPAALTVLDVAGEPSVEGTPVAVAAPSVFETLFPVWLRWRDRRVFVLTEARQQGGARAAVYGADGERLATGPRVAGGAGWTHLLAVAPFAPDGTRELATVMKPHVNHELRFFRWTDDGLRQVASHAGYTSHTLADGRNVDRVRAGDFDGDGRVELLVPTLDQTRLGGLRRTTGGVTAAWEVPIGGTLVSNLATASADGRCAVAAGRADGVLRVWPGRTEGK